jgi:hypothetical protein
MNEILIGYLTYINDINSSYRYDDFIRSLSSLKSWKNQTIISIDNNSNDDVKNNLKNSGLFSHYFHYNKNYYDIVLFYTSYWYASEINSKYVLFTYDDFILHDADAIKNCISFMDNNPDIACTRITDYFYENQRLYDADRTSKRNNPDAVRHYNNVSNEKLTWEGPIKVGNYNFYKNNWHYTSRPAIWRVNNLQKILPITSTVPVLQKFEGYVMKEFHKLGLKVGVLDKGMLRSSPTTRSARTMELKSDVEHSIEVDLQKLRQEYDSLK